LKNVEYFSYFGSIIINDAGCTRAMNSRIAMAKTAVKKKKNLFTIKLEFKEGNCRGLPLDYSFVWCWNMDTSKRRSEVPWKFWNVMLEKAVEDQLDLSCVKWITSISCSRTGVSYI